MDDLVHWLEDNGFLRTTTVREPGEYAVRGGILDLFAGGAARARSASTSSATRWNRSAASIPTRQRTIAARKRDRPRAGQRDGAVAGGDRPLPRSAMSTLFGAADRDDLLYQSVSEGRRYVGMEHWLPLFSEGLETLFDHVGDAPVVLDHLVDEAVGERLDQIADHYRGPPRGARGRAGRRRALQAAPAGPALPDRARMGRAACRRGRVPRISPFAQPEARRASSTSAGARGRNFAAERNAGDVNVFDAVIAPYRGAAEGPASASSSPAGARARATAWARCSSTTA